MIRWQGFRRLIAAALISTIAIGANLTQFEAAKAATVGDASTVDYALSLNGTSDYLQVVEGTAFVSRAVYSVETWVKPNAGNCSSGAIGTCAITSHDGDWWIGVQDGVYKYLVYYTNSGSNTGYVSSGVPAVANTWAHLSLVRNDTSINFYVDGQIASTTNVSSGRSTYATAYPVNVGWHYGAYFAGQVDELRLWSAARTSTEILTDMNAYQTSAPTTANLVAYWDFNEGGSNTTINNRVLTASTNLTYSNAIPVPAFVDVKSSAKVNGKTIVTFPRSYLTPSGGWAIPTTYTRAEALVVAGGGGGGSRHAGGGGAGELAYLSNYAPTAGSVIPIKVGQGGRGMTATTTNAAMSGQPGQNSTLGATTYLGGGAGAGGTSGATSGGSGGGLAGGGTAQAAGAGTGLKFAGGVGSFSGAIYAGGGGGGAGGAGGSAATVNTVFRGGNGGAGYQSSITGTALCYASGGGAGAMSVNFGVGGTCSSTSTRAGSGSYNTAATSAVANSGSGGGAGGFDGVTNQAAGNGGSGVIVIAYGASDDKALTTTATTTYASTTSQIFPTNTAQDYTFEIWAKPTSIPSGHQPIAVSDADMATRFYLGTLNTSGTTTSSQIHVAVGNSYFTSIRSIRASEWSHLAVTVSGTTASLYINGTLDSSATVTRVVHSSGLMVGHSTNTGTTQYFAGQLDQVKVWYSALPATQVSRSMQAYGDSDGSQIASTLQHGWDFNLEVSSTYQNMISSVDLNKNGLPTLTSLASSTVTAPNTIVTFDRTYFTAWGGWVSPVLANNGYAGNVLIVGAGGGSGKGTSRTNQPAGAGGGGGVSTLSAQVLTAGNVFPVKVGVGGAGAVSIADDASTRNGQSTAFNTTTVLGGGGGGSFGFAGAGGSSVATGGGGGGALASVDCNTLGSAGGVATSGLNGSAGVWGWGGAGAGAGGSATNGSCATNYGTPGAGVTSSLGGTAVEYGRGGLSSSNASSTAAVNTGAGGNAQYGTATGDGSGTDGAAGKVVISFRSFWVMSYDPNGGVGTQPDSYISWPTSCQNLTAVPFVNYTRAGYNFSGWKTGNVGIGTNGVCTQPSGDRIWAAQWSDAPVLNLDAALTTSLAITGASWTSVGTLAPGISAFASTAIAGQTYNAGPPNYLALSDAAYVNMGSNNAANISGAITVEVWAKCTAYRSGNSNNILASKWFSTPAGAAATGNDWQFGLYGDRLTLSTTNSTYKAGNTAWDSTKCSSWNNYAFTLDPSNNNTLTFYVNGVADGSYTGVTHTTFANTILQLGDGRPGEGFQGNYSKFRFYNLALSSAQMSAKYTADVAYFAEAYTTTYNYNGADGGTRPVSNGYNPGGTAITLPTPTKTGYTFGGWYSDSNLTSSIGAAGASYSPTSSGTVYAKWTANTLTVTYNSNGGSSVTAGSTTTGGTIATAPTDPTKTGYTFAGWFTDSGLTTQAVFPNFVHGQTANFTLYAKWTANTLTVTYNSNGGSTVADGTTTSGGTITSAPTAPSKTGYAFAGWFTDSGLTTQAVFPNFVHGQTSNFTLYAKWTAATYTLTYVYNGATSGNSTPSAGYTTGGSAIALPTPSKTGYTFAGWFADSGLQNSVSGNQTPSADATLYASWTANSLTVTYNSNGGSTVSNGSTTTGGTMTSAPADPIQTGFTFAGWYTDSGLTTQAVFPNFVHGQTSNFTLYAKWSANTLTVTYNSNGGSAVSNGSTTTGGTMASAPADPTKAGYSFAGWFTNAGLTTQAVFPNFVHGQTANFTLYAKWSANTLTVTYNSNGGSAVSNGSTTTAGTISSAPVSPTKIGYDFAGWFTNAGLTTQAVFPNFVHGQTSNFTLYAKWTSGSFSLTYEYNGGDPGNGIAAFGYTTGDSAISLPAPTKTGYTFAGWFADSGFQNAVVGDQTPSADLTLYAKWTADALTVTYNSNGGSAVSDGATYTAATISSAPASPTKQNYTFAGWYTNSGLSTQAVFPNFVHGQTANFTLYAKWTPATFVLTYSYNGATGGSRPATSNYIFGGSPVVLPTPTRTHFHFDGWFDATSGGTLVGLAGANLTISAATTIHARWTQDSLFGIGPNSKIVSLTVTNGLGSQYTAVGSTNSVNIVVPSGALPDGTALDVYVLNDSSNAQAIIGGSKSFIVSLVVAWLASDGTVPTTATGKPIVVTVTNSSIKAGASIYRLIGGVAEFAGFATQDGTAQVTITDDPELVIAATAPTAPLSVTAAVTGTTATVSWLAPSSTGGSDITSYLVTSSTGQTCSTALFACEFTNLTYGVAQTYTVNAINALGSSVLSAASNSVTATQAQNSPIREPAASGPVVVAPIVADPTSWAIPVPSPQVLAGQQVAVTESGIREIAIVPNSQKTGFVASTGTWAISLEVERVGDTAPAILDSKLQLFAGESLALSGSGMVPNSTIKVWFFSTPKLIGTISANASGNFSAKIALPVGLALGDHTLVLQTVGADLKLESQQFPVTLQTRVSHRFNVVFAATSIEISNATISKLNKFASSLALKSSIQISSTCYVSKKTSKAQAAKVCRARMAEIKLALKSRKIVASFNISKVAKNHNSWSALRTRLAISAISKT